MRRQLCRAGAASRASPGGSERDLIHSLASVGPDPHAGHAARDHPARRDVLPGEHLQRRHHVRHAPGGLARGAPRGRPDRRHAGGARRDRATSSSSTARASASCHHGATLPARAARDARGRGAGTPPARRPPRGAVRGREATRTRTRSCWSARAPSCPTTWWWCWPATPSPTTRSCVRSPTGSALTGRCVFADYVPDAELEGLWRMAGCAAFPTRAEGFGLPVLEAMARGVPVACSDLPVLREVGGDAPLLLRPGRSAADAARKVAEALAAAAIRCPAAPSGRRSFTWDAAAAGTCGPTSARSPR